MPRITTKLSYINIAQHWLRECIQNNIINIKQININNMVVDGLMKALTAQKHQYFIRLLRFVDIKHLIYKETTSSALISLT